MTKCMWLKKYTKLEYLNSILGECALHLGDPTTWDDKNDAFAFSQYSKAKGHAGVRATCLTASSDRFHFWHIFGAREEGVCLWFDRKLLMDSFENEAHLTVQAVNYCRECELEGKKVDELPFLKRMQYSDEREWRVVRYASESGRVPSSRLEFPPNALRKIYLNAWGSPSRGSTLGRGIYSASL